jgi:hypothetical protein
MNDKRMITFNSSYWASCRSAIKSGEALCVGFLALIFSFAACGGGGGSNDFSNVTVGVSPTNATVAAGGQVSLQASVTGLLGDASPAVTWTMQN